MRSNEMRVYVGTYGRYNAGSLFGKWLDLADYADKDEFYAACQELHKNEYDPEFMFQDYEGIPDGLIGESWISPAIWEIADVIPETEQEAFFSYVALFRPSLENVSQAYESFCDAYHGQWDSFSDFVESFLRDTGFFEGVSESFIRYFDYKAYGECEMLDFDIDENGFVFAG